MEISLEQRVARLEGKLGWRDQNIGFDERFKIGAALLLAGALICGLLGLGFPNHYYQLVLALLAVLLAEHRGFFARRSPRGMWFFNIFNVAGLAVFLKLFLGGGIRQPFFWLCYPKLISAAPPGQAAEKWIPNPLAHLQLVWEPSQLASWSIDLTMIQTFLLILVLISAMFDMDVIIAAAVLLLLLISLPAFVGFHWSWIFPAMLALAAAFYLQSAEANRKEVEP